ncbi:hypothetical protein DMN91_009468, partial [Ooceraea biroi]
MVSWEGCATDCGTGCGVSRSSERGTSGNPQPKYKWFKDGVALNNELISDPYFRIQATRREDAGVYHCVASNDVGSIFSDHITFAVAYMGVFEDLTEKVVNVESGNAAILQLPPIESHPAPRVEWVSSDGIPLYGIKYATTQRTLLILNASEGDNGIYRARAFNTQLGKEENSPFFKLQVTGDPNAEIVPTIIVKPQDTQIIKDQDVTYINCIANARSLHELRTLWMKDGIPIENSRISYSFNDSWNRTLALVSANITYTGVYSCHVDLRSGDYPTVNASAKIVVYEKPTFITELKRETLSDYGSTVTLPCDTVGVPPPTVAWFRNAEPINHLLGTRVINTQASQRLKMRSDGTLQIIAVRASDVGEYTCSVVSPGAAAAYQFRVKAENSVGTGPSSAPSNIVVLPQEPPSGPPIGFVGSARSSSEIITQWQPPLEEYRNGQILGYVLMYKLDGYNDSPWTIQNITNEAQRNYLITDLITWKDYMVQIAAYNDKGVGVFTDGLTIKTKEGAKAINSTAVKVWWKPPNPQKINGINQGYKLQAWIGSNVTETNEYKSITVPPSLLDPLAEQSAVMAGLRKYTLYNITVLCFTDPGDGERSSPVKVRTLEDAPEEVENLQFEDISDRALTIKWAPPKEINGILTHYQLKYMIKDILDSQRVENFTANILSTKVEHLQALTHYKFEVTAWTSVGAGKPRIAIIQSGVEPVLPEPPTKLALSNIDAFSVVLQFTPGFDGNSSITKWTVQALTARNSTWYNIYEVSDPDASTITVGGLIPFVQYKLRLIANNVPLQQIEWYGNPRGYNVTYTEVQSNISQSIIIEDPTANSYVLENMEEYADYEIVMRAFNDVGFSAASPKAIERTRESVPSLGPINVEANATSSTTILVRWGDVPVEHQNGQIEGFKVYYGANSRSPFQYKNIPSNSTFTTTLTELRKFVQYHVQVLAYTRLGDGVLSTPPLPVHRLMYPSPIATELEPEKYYMFSVTAQTRLGWGKTAYALVFTTNNRERPQAPSVPQVSKSQVQSRQITFSWTPGKDGFAPLRYYTVQQSENSGPFQIIPERVEPTLTSYTANNLKPYTFYQFRIQATNDIGPSDWSTESAQVQTLPAAPSKGVTGLKVVPITTSSVEVHWNMIDEIYWSGDHETGGYRVVYQPISDFPTPLQATPKKDVIGIKETEMVLSNLTEDRYYEIIVLPFNSEGEGPPSRPVTVYVGEAVPTGEPQHLKAEPISSTEVHLRWKPLQANMQNGDLLGYKVFYLVTNSPQDIEKKQEEEIEVVPATCLAHSLVFLDKYTEYRIQVLAFNPAGDGPRSPPITVRTKQDIPGPPHNLQFSEITMTSLRVSWEPPKLRNGEIVGYIVTYETAEQNDRFSKQVKQKVTETSLLIQPLEEEVTYTFMVRAQTIDFGPPVSGNVTTGPQEGSPMAPSNLDVTKTVSSVELEWTNGASGKGPILGYYIETRRKEEAQKTLEESMAMDADDRQESDLELYRSRQGGGSSNTATGTLGKRNTLARKAMHPPPPTMLGKSPPRPSPASVAYNSDEESLKGYDENPDDSSVTEKPSEI